MRKWQAWAGLRPAREPLSAPYFRDAVIAAPDRPAAEAEARLAFAVLAEDQHLGDVDIQVTELVPLPEVGETVWVASARNDSEDRVQFVPPLEARVTGLFRGRPDANTGFYVPDPEGGDLYVLPFEKSYRIAGQD